MNSTEFNELAGRIQGLSDFLLHLTAQLEVDGIIDGPRLTKGLRVFAHRRRFPEEHLTAAKRTLDELAHFLDEAREARARQ
jgi:hypothetical protein